VNPLKLRTMHSKEEQIVEEQIVYLVDDDADVREGVSALLQSVGLKVVALSSTVEFLAHKGSQGPSCLILDVRLPGLSGLDFQTELAKTQNDIPIIFITGHGDIPMTVKAMKAGAVEFLTKPFRDQDLLDAVRFALERDRAHRELQMQLQSLRSRYDSLSDRERQVMSLVCAGLMNKQVAAEIGVSEVTVKVHRHNLMKKLDARSFAELVRMADVLRIPRGK
jgi:RNA polymerase sigma factor (sigma-70 family)